MKNQPSDIIRSFSIISRYSRRYIHHRIQEQGNQIGHSQVRFLALLHHGFTGKRQEDFTQALKKDKGTVARAMARLEDAGLIRRETDTDDRRAYRIYPTKKAEEHFASIDAIMNDWEQILLKDFRKEEKQMLLELLKKMEHNVCAIDTKPTSTPHWHTPTI